MPDDQTYWTMTCPTTWPLDAPSPEDLANKITHGCVLSEGHEGLHRCTCGLYLVNDDDRVNEHGNVIDYGPQFGEEEDG